MNLRRFVWLRVVVLTLVSHCAFASSLQYQELVFENRGVNLSGTLVLPAQQPPQSVVVFVHGSGAQTRNLLIAEKFAGDGIAAFVYDKRGVGKSGGDYESQQSVSEKNIRLLANDALAAVHRLKRHPVVDDVPVGLVGISQAGWIVPLAAAKTDLIDYLVIWSGPVCKVSEEDIFSKYTADKDTNTVPSYLEALSARTSPYIWPDFLGEDTDPSVSLAKLRIPGLWLFGAQDGSIPVDLSIARLDRLIEQGHAYDYVLFSAAGHNNMGMTFDTALSWIKTGPLQSVTTTSSATE